MKPIMKKVIVFIAFCCSFISNMEAQKSIRSMYREHKRDGKENTHFILPRPVFWVGSLFLPHRAERKLLRTVKQMRLLAIEEGANIAPASTKAMVAQAEGAGFEPLITIRDGSTRVSIHAKERKGKIRGLFIVVHEQDSFFLIYLKTRTKMKDLDRLLIRLAKEKKLDSMPKALEKQLKIDRV
jgi:hypothetical protein